MQQGRVVSTSHTMSIYLYNKVKLTHFYCTKCGKHTLARYLKYSTKDENICCNCGKGYIPASIKAALESR
jgi:predicted RNA-binding Zn-ribbon protein involved in translation (DUF1610 family)